MELKKESSSMGKTEIIIKKSNDGNLEDEDKTISGEVVAGTVYGNISNASTNYGQDRFATPHGHGFAAERANHLYDKLTGQDAKIVGDNNLKYGADRIVGGINIQSKYCSNGSRCISECFDNGKMKYINQDGTPMQIEVPLDKYDEAVQSMKERIKKGQVPGVTDPKEAKNIVKKGHFTYQQAKNIAKAGTVESITFDAVNGAIVAASAFGISTVLSFATAIWNGKEFEVALKKATCAGLKVGGTSFISAVLTGQLAKSSFNSALIGGSETLVNIMGPKASAMKSAAKMFRGNVITSAVSIVVLSSADVVNIFRGRISGKQLFKNIATTATGVAGGTAGWIGGAAAGAAMGSVIPIIGTAVGSTIGGLLGAFAGGTVSSKASNAVLGAFIEEDADEMVEIIEKVFIQMADDYLLNQREAEEIAKGLQKILSGNKLREMYACSDRKGYANALLIDIVEHEVDLRQKVQIPTIDEMQHSLRTVLEEIEMPT